MAGDGAQSSLPGPELTPPSFLPSYAWLGLTFLLQGPGLCDICIYCILLILIENKALFSLSFPPFFSGKDFIFPLYMFLFPYGKRGGSLWVT